MRGTSAQYANGKLRIIYMRKIFSTFLSFPQFGYCTHLVCELGLFQFSSNEAKSG
jgi:hypothetical protein